MANTYTPHLPAELWAQVLQDVDDPFTLWVDCRQVSRAWRKESEHAFRVTYLPILHIEWTIVSFGRVEHTVLATTDGYSIDPQSSTLSLVLRSGEPRPSERFTTAQWLEEARWILNYDDYRLWVKGERFKTHGQAIWFDAADGRYTFVGTVETRKLNSHLPAQEAEAFTRRRMACDWKSLMDALFAEEMYVRQRHPGPCFYELGEQGIRGILAEAEKAIIIRTAVPDPELSARGSSGRKKKQVTLEKAIAVESHLYQEKVKKFLRMHCRHTEDFKRLYAAAFQERLRRAFERKDKDLYTQDSFLRVCDANQQLNYNLEDTGCRWVMESRLERFQAFADGIWRNTFEGQD